MTTVMGAKELQGLLRVWSDTTPTVLIPHVQDEATEPVTIDEAVSAAHGIYDMNIAHRVYDGPVVAYCAECRHISRTDVTL